MTRNGCMCQLLPIKYELKLPSEVTPGLLPFRSRSKQCDVVPLGSIKTPGTFFLLFTYISAPLWLILLSLNWPHSIMDYKNNNMEIFFGAQMNYPPSSPPSPFILHIYPESSEYKKWREQASGYSFWDRLRNFLQNFTQIVLSVHKLNKPSKFW